MLDERGFIPLHREINLYMMNKQLQRGFTVIELMIAIMILGVLVTIAAPSFAEILKQNRLAAQTNSIIASLNYARGETINQGTDVFITPNTAGTNWSGGWAVRSGTAGGPILRTFDGFQNATLTASSATINYQADGSITGGAAVTLTVTPSNCDTGDNDLRVVTIALSGQTSSAPAACP